MADKPDHLQVCYVFGDDILLVTDDRILMALLVTSFLALGLRLNSVKMWYHY